MFDWQAFASSGPQLPKIPSFHKFARREQHSQIDDCDLRRKWTGGVLGRQDCVSEIDSRNCRVREWSVDFSAACPNLESSRVSVDNASQQSHSNEIACHMNLREHSGESAAADSSIFTKAWVDTAGSGGIKDSHAIERWQSQAAAADPDFFHSAMHIKDEEDSNTSSKPRSWKHDRRANESSVSQATVSKEPLENHPRGADRMKQAIVDYAASLLMPIYKARKIDRDGYKSIMKKCARKVNLLSPLVFIIFAGFEHCYSFKIHSFASATFFHHTATTTSIIYLLFINFQVMEQATDAEKAMAVSDFLDSKRRHKVYFVFYGNGNK